MMALQKSLMEQSDIVPVLKEMDFVHDPEDSSHSTLVVTNPPVVNFEGVTLGEAEDALTDET